MNNLVNDNSQLNQIVQYYKYIDTSRMINGNMYNIEKDLKNIIDIHTLISICPPIKARPDSKFEKIYSFTTAIKLQLLYETSINDNCQMTEMSFIIEKNN